MPTLRTIQGCVSDQHASSVGVARVSLSVEPISAAEHLAFVQMERSVRFLQTPAWGRVKAEWRCESLGWCDGRQLVGAGLVRSEPNTCGPSFG